MKKNEIAEFMERHNITIYRCAKVLGKHESSIKRWLIGRYPVPLSIKHLLRYANNYHEKHGKFLGEQGLRTLAETKTKALDEAWAEVAEVSEEWAKAAEAIAEVAARAEDSKQNKKDGK